MIENIINLVTGNQIETLILVLIGLLLGALIITFYWKRQISKREAHISELDTTLEKKDADLKDIRARAQELLNEKEKEIGGLNSQLNETKINLENQVKDNENIKIQLSQREVALRDIRADKDESINLLKKQVFDLEGKNRDSVIRAEGAETKGRELEKALEEKTEEAANYDRRKQEAETKVMELTHALEEKIEEAENFDKMNQDSVARAESAEARIEELEKSLEEKSQESTILKARMRMMQDDFTHIAGIGPKVSSVLRLAGLNTFSKLAGANIDKIKDILEAENPSLLRLTDPATWLEQARLAAEENWEGLIDLQERIKSSRNT